MRFSRSPLAIIVIAILLIVALTPAAPVLLCLTVIPFALLVLEAASLFGAGIREAGFQELFLSLRLVSPRPPPAS